MEKWDAGILLSFRKNDNDLGITFQVFAKEVPMERNSLLPAHGGCGLINRMIPEIERKHFIERAGQHKTYVISNADLSCFYRMADGGLSPLEGPMGKEEFERVLQEEVIERNGKKYAWTIPMAFPLTQKERKEFLSGETVAVKNEHGQVVGVIEISEIYSFDKKAYNRCVYGTDRNDHPGPRIVNDDPREFLMGGKIWALPPEKHFAFEQYVLTPKETRSLFQERGWQRIVAFQTRNALHRAHEYTMVYAMETLAQQGFLTGVILNPLVGSTKKDDVPADVRMKTYEALIDQKLIGRGDKNEDMWKKKEVDLTDNLRLIGLDIKMFYAGPKEAVMHAVYRQNFGFTDIIIGRRHADAPFDDGTQVWGDFDAQEIFEKLKGELLIRPLNVGFAAYFEELGRVGLVDEHKDKSYHTVSISGKDLRKKLQAGEPVDERIMRKPVADILKDFYAGKTAADARFVSSRNITWHDTRLTKKDREAANEHKGAVLWLTGLPSSGKSTIAVELQSVLFRRGCQAYVLDGDNIRHGLNKDLGFSPEDREENIRRIGEVARLFVDAGFLVITSFISPYRRDRDNARALLPEGEFLEIFVQTSLEECERRDPKGLYKKARAGEIKEFTGISAPYEEPENPEIVINTENETKEESASYIARYLEDNKYIPRQIPL